MVFDNIINAVTTILLKKEPNLKEKIKDRFGIEWLIKISLSNLYSVLLESQARLIGNNIFDVDLVFNDHNENDKCNYVDDKLEGTFTNLHESITGISISLTPSELDAVKKLAKEEFRKQLNKNVEIYKSFNNTSNTSKINKSVFILDGYCPGGNYESFCFFSRNVNDPSQASEGSIYPDSLFSRIDGRGNWKITVEFIPDTTP